MYVPNFVKYSKYTENEDDIKREKENEAENNEKSDLKVTDRCQRLFNSAVCQKLVEVFYQWSVAGASVKASKF